MIFQWIEKSKSAWKTVVQLRSEAGWAHKGIREGVFTGLGLLGDLLKPWLYLLPAMLMIAMTVAACSFLLWWRQCRLHHLNPPSKRRITASAAMYGLLGSLIFAPLLTVDLASNESSGAVTSMLKVLQPMQNDLIARLDRMTKSLTDLHHVAVQQKDEVEKQGKVMSQVKDTMDLSVALMLLDRAQAARDGSNQGQVGAVQFLLSRGIDFVQRDLSGVSLAGASLEGANFSGASLHLFNIDDAKLTKANFNGADLRFSSANNTDFTAADLSGSFAAFFSGRGANFAHAKLNGANFYGADLSHADFTDADLTGAVLAFADLDGANFTGARLTDSFLAGALLTTANLSDANMEGADVLSTVRAPSTLSDSQRSLICRHQVSDVRFDIRIKERRESNRYPSGYEYEDVSSLGNVVAVASFEDKSLPICSAKPEDVNGYSPAYPGDLSLFLERTYLKNASRFAKARARLKEFYSKLNKAYAAGTFITGNDQYREAWVRDMTQRASKEEPKGVPMIDSDLILVWLLSKSALRPEDVDWPAMARTRLAIEQAQTGRPELPSVRNPFFPEGADFEDLPDEAVSLFRQWTLHRASQPSERLVIQTSSIVRRGEGGVASRLFVSDGGYIRKTVEGLAISSTSAWPEAVTKVIGTLVETPGRARPAPAAIRLVNKGCCFTPALVFPASFDHYAVTLPENLRVGDESVLELELAVVDIQRPATAETALIYVAPQGARIRDNQGKVIFSGPLEETAP